MPNIVINNNSDQATPWAGAPSNPPFYPPYQPPSPPPYPPPPLRGTYLLLRYQQQSRICQSRSYQYYQPRHSNCVPAMAQSLIYRFGHHHHLRPLQARATLS